MRDVVASLGTRLNTNGQNALCVHRGCCSAAQSQQFEPKKCALTPRLCKVTGTSSHGGYRRRLSSGVAAVYAAAAATLSSLSRVRQALLGNQHRRVRWYWKLHGCQVCLIPPPAKVNIYVFVCWGEVG